MGKTHAPKTVNEMKAETMQARLQKMLILRAQHEANIDEVHVVLQGGNSKTGTLVYTTSFMPVVDCPNCAHCKGKCYDLRNDCWRPTVQNDRARNSAIHRLDPERYWKEVEESCKLNNANALRINVGGDVTLEDMQIIYDMSLRNPSIDYLFFTKNYDDANYFLDQINGNLPENLHMIFSRWPNMECDNRYNMPESHILWKDGSTTAPQYGAYFCQGDCTECLLAGEGCWTLKRNEHVVFNAH